MAGVWTQKAQGDSTGGPRLDLDEARHALPLILQPGTAAELFSIFPPRHTHIASEDMDALIWEVNEHKGSVGNYVSLNPLPAGFTAPPGRGAKVDDFAARRWFFLDVDPVRPAKDSNATDDEHRAAADVVSQCIAFLAGKGWPDPLLIDSGNGWQALWRVDLPNDNTTRALFKRVLKGLEAFNTDGAKVDTDTAKATSHCRIPGTWNRKGPHESARPHRMVRLARVPAKLEVVTLEQLRDVAGVVEGPARPKASPFRQHAPQTGREAAYGRAALLGECANVRNAAVGQRNTTLNNAALKVGGYVASGCLPRYEAEALLLAAALDVGLEEREARATIKSGLDAGEKEPKLPPEQTNGHAGPGGKSCAPPPPKGRVTVRASSIQPRQVEWLWPGRIPLGKLTTFAGVGGLGKTFVLCDMTARVTRGLPWPDGSAGGPPARVLFITGEDDFDDTIVPRLIELGADLDRVVFLTTEAQDAFTLADLDTLERALSEAADVRFIAIDPPTAFLGDVDDHKNAPLRGLLAPLKSWSGRHRLATVFNTHFTKPSGAKVEAMMRVMGSVAWVNAVRAAHAFTRDPHDWHRRLFIPMKNNLGPEKKGLAYRIEVTESLARIEWQGEVETTADEAVGPGKPKRRVAAADWLEELFADPSAEIPSRTVFQRTQAETALSDDALREAKDDMGIRAQQVADADGRRCWKWFWPPSARQEWQRRKQAGKGPSEESFSLE